MTAEVLDAMGISRPVIDEVIAIIGRMPTTDELSTLMAMWESNGRQQSLLQWLKGQPHDAAPRHDYLYAADDDEHKAIHEPKIRECMEIAQQICHHEATPAAQGVITHGQLIYLIGSVPTQFLDSDYARQYLHIVDNPAVADNSQEAEEYTSMILDAMTANDILSHHTHVGVGGLFMALATMCGRASCGFDILTCREVRLDAFLFGEEKARYITTIDESQEDNMIEKLKEARINCCFLGRVTRRRIVIDGYDFDDVDKYLILPEL